MTPMPSSADGPKPTRWSPDLGERISALESLARSVFNASCARLDADHPACAWARATRDEGRPLVVEDAALDERFAGLPEVRSESVGWHASVAVRWPDGTVAGTFAVRGPEPRRFDSADSDRLGEFGSLAEGLLASAWASSRAAEQKQIAEGLLEGTGMAVAMLRAVRDDDGAVCDFTYEAWNDRICAITDTPSSAYERGSMLELFPTLGTSGRFEIYRGILDRDEPLDQTLEYLHGNLGGWFRVVGHKHDDERIVVSFEDVTEAVKAKLETEQRERELLMFIEHAPAALAVFDRDMRYLTASKRWISDYRIEDRDIIGSLHYQVFPDIPARWKTFHSRCLDGEVMRSAKDRVVHADGTERWLRWEMRPWFDTAGEVGGIVIMTEDISARVEAERRLRRYSDRLELALQATGLGMWDLDLRDGKAVYSGTWYRMLGYEPGEFRHDENGFRKIAHPEDYPFAKAFFKEHKEGKHPLYRAEIRLRRADGRWMWVEDIGKIVEWDDDGTPLRAVGVQIDLESRKQIEQTLARHAEETTQAMRTVERQSRELKRKNAELDTARRRAEEASEAKSAFLANMSHELRTPMTAIIGFAELLADEHRDQDAEELQQFEVIRRNAEHLLQLVNQVLDLSKIDAQRMTAERSEVFLPELLRDTVEWTRVKAEGSGARVTSRCLHAFPNRVMTDPTRLRQILVNLLGNAVRFAPRGHVTLEVGCEHRTHAELVIDVVDDGVGIHPDKHAHIFETFAQGDESTTREFGGTGLGLAISRSLAALLGGSLNLVESSPGNGSRFRLRLPVETGPHAVLVDTIELCAVRATGPTRERRLEARVLVAEDGPDNQKLIRHLLTRAGAQVDIAPDGRAAVDAWRRARDAGEAYDIVLMDVQMPILDGHDATRALRDAGCRVPILALTARAFQEDRARCLAAGCDGFLAKPFKPAHLIEACNRALGRESAGSPAD